jgi:hypothetical protein
MALVGIVSTQLLDDLFVRNFPALQDAKLDDLRVFTS